MFRTNNFKLTTTADRSLDDAKQHFQMLLVEAGVLFGDYDKFLKQKDKFFSSEKEGLTDHSDGEIRSYGSYTGISNRLCREYGDAFATKKHFQVNYALYREKAKKFERNFAALTSAAFTKKLNQQQTEECENLFSQYSKTNAKLARMFVTMNNDINQLLTAISDFVNSIAEENKIPIKNYHFWDWLIRGITPLHIEISEEIKKKLFTKAYQLIVQYVNDVRKARSLYEQFHLQYPEIEKAKEGLICVLMRDSATQHLHIEFATTKLCAAYNGLFTIYKDICVLGERPSLERLEELYEQCVHILQNPLIDDTFEKLFTEKKSEINEICEYYKKYPIDSDIGDTCKKAKDEINAVLQALFTDKKLPGLSELKVKSPALAKEIEQADFDVLSKMRKPLVSKVEPLMVVTEQGSIRKVDDSFLLGNHFLSRPFDITFLKTSTDGSVGGKYKPR